MKTIFYSWQGDRPTGVCRNLIERCVQSAVDRLRADVEINEAIRDELQVDQDTKNVPGTPPVFHTIMAKIAASSVFVSDLSFVGERFDGRPTSNPNVLIEYGYALASPGSQRIIGVMNDAYGKPTSLNLPFNLAHTRFPVTYTLTENAGEEEKKSARSVLIKSLEVALRTIFDSSGYRDQVKCPRSRLLRSKLPLCIKMSSILMLRFQPFATEMVWKEHKDWQRSSSAQSSLVLAIS